MAKLIQSTAVKGPTFDPNKKYKWNPEDIFEITGQQFASIYHALTSDVRTPGGAPMFITYEAYQVMMSVFSKGVEQGVITETDTLEPEMIQDTDSNVKELFKK